MKYNAHLSPSKVANAHVVPTWPSKGLPCNDFKLGSMLLLEAFGVRGQ